MTKTNFLCSLIGPGILPLIKKLKFNIICSLLFRIERGGSRRDKLVNLSQYMIEGVWSVAINLFFTRYNCSLQASADVWNMLKDLIAGKKVELQRGANSHQNLPSCLLSKRNQNNEEVTEEIVDNIILILFRLQDMTLHLF
ncbi:hypothetical protein NC653_004322 [Populus alba x Populus x berolinensis]|uniref:Uncharacterized protein n=1 Tax=Populus alba x Populus x berolinensis TaxID=444605 RepID=A0AAD6WKD7_9ROSI|nr:hypothetical protein NC653_004322 [Populus alba x Populus x berolinensis]